MFTYGVHLVAKNGRRTISSWLRQLQASIKILGSITLEVTDNGGVIDDLQNYCVGACNVAIGVVKCVARPAAHMPKTGEGHSVHTNFDRQNLMTLNNRRSVVVLPIFTPNTLLERACFELNENDLVLKMKQGTVKWQGFKIGQSVGWAAPVGEHNVRWWTMNICHSVVSCLIFKTKVSLKRRCFQQCLELENLIKYDAGWYIFFVAMLNWIAASPVNCIEGESVDNWHWFRESSRPSV